MEDIVRRISQPDNKRYRGRNELYKNIHRYRGKHYMEKYGSGYIGSKEFEDLLQKMNIHPIKKRFRSISFTNSQRILYLRIIDEQKQKHHEQL